MRASLRARWLAAGWTSTLCRRRPGTACCAHTFRSGLLTRLDLPFSGVFGVARVGGALDWSLCIRDAANSSQRGCTDDVGYRTIDVASDTAAVRILNLGFLSGPSTGPPGSVQSHTTVPHPATVLERSPTMSAASTGAESRGHRELVLGGLSSCWAGNVWPITRCSALLIDCSAPYIPCGIFSVEYVGSRA